MKFFFGRQLISLRRSTRRRNLTFSLSVCSLMLLDNKVHCRKRAELLNHLEVWQTLLFRLPSFLSNKQSSKNTSKSQSDEQIKKLFPPHLYVFYKTNFSQVNCNNKYKTLIVKQIIAILVLTEKQYKWSLKGTINTLQLFAEKPQFFNQNNQWLNNIIYQ